MYVLWYIILSFFGDSTGYWLDLGFQALVCSALQLFTSLRYVDCTFQACWGTLPFSQLLCEVFCTVTFPSICFPSSLFFHTIYFPCLGVRYKNTNGCHDVLGTLPGDLCFIHFFKLSLFVAYVFSFSLSSILPLDIPCLGVWIMRRPDQPVMYTSNYGLHGESGWQIAPTTSFNYWYQWNLVSRKHPLLQSNRAWNTRMWSIISINFRTDLLNISINFRTDLFNTANIFKSSRV